MAIMKICLPDFVIQAGAPFSPKKIPVRNLTGTNYLKLAKANYLPFAFSASYFAKSSALNTCPAIFNSRG